MEVPVWSACVHHDAAGGPVLMVAGTVEVPATNYAAGLVQSDQPGILETLYLDVVVAELPMTGLPALTERDVSYVMRPYPGGYSAVVVSQDGEPVVEMFDFCQLP